MEKQIYLSYSGSQQLSVCHRKVFYNAHRKTYLPMHRSAALVKGSAIHAAIRTLHQDPTFSPALVYAQELDYIEGDSTIPVKWGAKGREWHFDDAVKTVEWYWHFNQGVNVLSMERWFYRPLTMPDGTTEWLRGRFDQVVDDNGKLVIRELKSGMVPNVQALRRDPQVLIQADACLNGYIELGDHAYVAVTDDDYHIHHWADEGDGIWGCTMCQSKAERFNKLPAQLVLYHVPSCRPLEKNIKKGICEPRNDPAYIINSDSMRIPVMQSRLIMLIMVFRTCIATGQWDQTNQTGFMNPCSNCEFLNHCEDGNLCTVDGREVDDNESE